MSSMEVTWGRQPKTLPARALSATSRAGSPARRGPTFTGMSRPVALRAALIISITE